MKEWHIPVKTPFMLSQNDTDFAYAKNIYDAIKNHDLNRFNALEIGGAWGLSTLAILEAGAKLLLTVDNNQNIEAHREAIANGYEENHTWSCVRSEQFWIENDDQEPRFDVIYIDGSHLYIDVVNDLYQGWKYLKPGGIMMADDWDHKKNIQSENNTVEYGVSLACWEFIRDHKCDIEIEGRILIFKKAPYVI